MQAETIIISGLPGTGSSTVARLVSEALGFEYVYAGGLFRAEAASRGLTVTEFNEVVKNDPEWERAFDRRLIKYAQAGKTVVESRTLGWILPEDAPSYKVWLICDREERLRRISEREGGAEEAAEADLRQHLERERYGRLYGFDPADLHDFHRVLDTTTITAQEAASIIVADIKI